MIKIRKNSENQIFVGFAKKHLKKKEIKLRYETIVIIQENIVELLIRIAI